MRHGTRSDWLVIGLILLVLAWGIVALAQQPPPPTQPAAPPCDEQLRITVTRYDIKKQQAELAEQNVAQLLEQLRQAREQQAELRSELEKAKNGGKPPAN